MKLNANDLFFRYESGSRQILNRVSFSIESGEIVGLCAPSGFGKTTLCKILAGYMKPDFGIVTIDEKPLSSYRGYCPIQMVWQHPEQAVNPRMNLSQTLKEAGMSDVRILERLGVNPAWMTRYPDELSGGELQRICIARALRPQTKFLLADEITAMLDLVTQAQIWTFLKEEAATRGIGILLVSHSAPLLKLLCTRQLTFLNETSLSS